MNFSSFFGSSNNVTQISGVNTDNNVGKAKLWVNGTEIELDSDSIRIEIAGNISFLSVQCKGSVNVLHTDNFAVQIHGEVGGEVTTKNGDIECGNVKNNVSSENGKVKCLDVGGFCKTQNGNITCGNVGGDVTTNMGNVNCNDVTGDVSTKMGNIKRK